MSNRSRYLQAWNAAYNDGNPDAFDGIIAADYIRHFREPNGFRSVGVVDFKAAVLEMRHDFLTSGQRSTMSSAKITSLLSVGPAKERI
jgi:hypothetical protein